jgi:hypothetical protein
MSCLKILLLITGTLLFLFAGKPVAFAQVEPDFSNFDDPNLEPPKRAKSQTEAEPPCITCGRQLPKSKNQEDLRAVSKDGKKQAAAKKKSRVKRKQQEDCITCGRDKISQESNFNQVSGESGWKQFPEIAAYSNSPQVTKMISWTENHHFRSSQGQCYRYVKEALCGAKRPRCQSGSLVDGYLSGNPVFADRASNVPHRKRVGASAIKTLEAQGFKNLLTDPATKDLIKNPASAPKGAILIYTGGNNGGHIEIKTGEGTKGSYISDFSAPDSVLQNELAGRASRRYQLVAVMVKPMEN